MVLQISCLYHYCLVTTALASSFWRMWGWFQAAWCAVNADHICPFASTLVLRSLLVGDVWGPCLLRNAVFRPQLCTELGIYRVNWTLWGFCFSRTTSFNAFMLTLSSKNISSVLQPLLIEPSSVERSCWTMCCEDLRNSAYLTRPSKSTKASSFGASAIGDVNWKGSVCSVVLIVCPEMTFLLAVSDRTANTLVPVLHYWNETGPTVISDCWPSYGTEKRTATNTKLWITRTVSLMCVLALVRTQSRAPGGMWKHFLIHTAGWGTKSFTWPTTCLRRTADSRKRPSSHSSSASLERHTYLRSRYLGQITTVTTPLVSCRRRQEVISVTLFVT